jgi:NAD(P)-dependent dehydrogenase (short-subunit alcohol dehydrogenase family)
MRIQPGMAAFITGAAGGMGLAMARAFGQAGLKVALADIDADRVGAAVRGLAAEGADVRAFPLDVRDEGAWARVRGQAWDWTGGVQILCNNAGVVFQGPLAEQPIEIWRLTQAVNLDGPYFGIRAFLPKMLESGAPGRIVNTASLAGLWGEGRLAAYTASKFALVGLSEALQLELARTPVGVTVVFPGPTATELGASTRKLAEDAGIVSAPPATSLAPRSAPRPAASLDPSFVGERVLRAIENDEFYVMTHPDWRPVLEARHDALLSAFGAAADPTYADDPAAVAKITARVASAFGRRP